MKKWLCVAVLSMAVLAAGCGESTTNENEAEVQNEKTVEDAGKTDQKDESETEETVESETEETQIIGYVALEGNGTGFVTETCGNITYSVPDAWSKKEEENTIYYRDGENDGVIYVKAYPFNNIDNIEIQNMLVDTHVEAITELDGYSDWGTSEGVLEYENKMVVMLYTYMYEETIYIGETLVINDLEGVTNITYIAPFDDENDDKLNEVADIFDSVKIINIAE